MARGKAQPPIQPFPSLVATLGVVLLGLLIFLITVYPGGKHSLPEPDLVPSAVSADWRQTFQPRVDALTVRLEGGPLELSRPTIELQQGGPIEYMHRQYEISLPREDEELLAVALELARGNDRTVSVSTKPERNGAQVQIGVDGLLTHTVEVHWRFPDYRDRPRVALIMDDLGNSLLIARELVSFDFPIALAVMPMRPFSREVAALAHHYGREVLLHLPMEAESGEAINQPLLLRAHAPRSEILRELERALSSVPHVIGVNNHMGSRFTQDETRMRWVLGYLKERDLFFVDSRTSPKTVGGQVAAAVGLPYLTRDVFLDDPADGSVVNERLDVLIRKARQSKVAIGIGHPRQSTVNAIRSFREKAVKEGVDIVPLTALLGRP